MDDILIHKRYGTCTVVGQTAEGKLWMGKNYGCNITTIPTSVLLDFLLDLKKLKLTYEDL